MQEIINAILKSSHDATTKNIIKLGELIKLLEIRPQDKPIRFDFCDFVPVSVDSYRGYYSDLAIGYSENGDITVANFLKMLNEVKDKTLEGYKGGYFVMHENVPVWVANYSCSHGTAVVGIKGTDYETIIQTAHID